jgi:hypothetical protein
MKRPPLVKNNKKNLEIQNPSATLVLREIVTAIAIQQAKLDHKQNIANETSSHIR